ncbi:beta-ketoacyl synthase N-terminal-like domain-containing protein [Enterobacter kobei]|uniref:beta-ketoacyl synthase N-terminal-like domain-containing protein n=2 Tax=Enterobacter kobei TaxID=208224 RepID=UPI002FD29022
MMTTTTYVANVVGMGWTTASGDRIEDVFQTLLEKQTGIAPAPSDRSLRTDLAAMLPGEWPAEMREKLIALTKRTARQALEDSGAAEPVPEERRFLIVGTSLGFRLDSEAFCREPLDGWVNEVAESLGMEGIALSTACSSGSDALLLGAHLIATGQADLCVCGGADILTDSKRLAHSALGTLSLSTLKSFDATHEGTILGEGAGFLVLQRESGSAPRVLARLVGAGASNDAAGLTAPDEQGNGIRLALQRALTQAGLEPGDIALINAHGSGTLTNDRVESNAYNQFFTHRPWVFATKGNFGHTLGATGALEAIALIHSLNAGTIPPVYELKKPIDGLRFNLPAAQPQPLTGKTGLSMTIGFGGFNTCLIFTVM